MAASHAAAAIAAAHRSVETLRILRRVRERARGNHLTFIENDNDFASRFMVYCDYKFYQLSLRISSPVTHYARNVHTVLIQLPML